MFTLRFLLLFLMWCAFSGLYDPFHLALGALSCCWVAAVSGGIAPPESPRNRPKRGLKFALGLIGYGFWLVMEVVKAALEVFRLTVTPKLEQTLSPSLMEFRTELADDFSRFLLAHSITLTPGTVTVRVDGDLFLVHSLTEKMASAVPGEMEARLLRLFGGQKDVEAGVA